MKKHLQKNMLSVYNEFVNSISTDIYFIENYIKSWGKTAEGVQTYNVQRNPTISTDTPMYGDTLKSFYKSSTPLDKPYI